jgi:phosphoadenosine phosphosulfate reductase
MFLLYYSDHVLFINANQHPNVTFTMEISKEQIESAQKHLSGATAEEILSYAADQLSYPVFATSLGQEDQVITAMIAKTGLDIPIFTLDTGRLFAETYELIAATEERFGLKIQIAFPDATEVERMVSEEGINLFLKSVDLRKRCCAVRKIQPLKRMLAASDGWICGLRRDQSPTRTDMHAVEWDDGNGIPKFNPLIDWSLKEVQEYLRDHDVPYSPLHDRGFVSIGCACCTRAIEPGEDIRAGRWWWEAPEHKECGLHFNPDGTLSRKNT